MNKKTLAKFCHDLKNPLSIMRINLDIFRLSESFKKADRMTKKIVSRVDKEIDKILEVIKKEGGK